MLETEIKLYAPRPYQAQLHQQLKRFNILVAHRRFGKTVFCINELIAKAAACPLREPRYAYVAPLLIQAKDVAWEYLKKYTRPIPDVQISETELRVDLPGGGRIRLYGADNMDRLRGLYFDGIILDEYAQMPPRLWGEVLRPALADRKGWAIFIGTPMGRNAFHEIYTAALRDKSWLALKFKASETGILPDEELAAARRAMSAEQYAQEFECSFEAAITGSYYAKLLEVAEEEGRLGKAPWEPSLPVHTAWDLGMADATSIWFAQQAGNEIRLIDYYEMSGVPLTHYAKKILEMPYVYGEHLLPHDAGIRELGSGKSRLEILRNLGIKARILRADKIEDGIEAVRMLIPKCWFDLRKTEKGVNALRQYRHEYDAKNQIFRPRPVHDWASHGADAFRYLAMGLRSPGKNSSASLQRSKEYDPFNW